MISCLDLNNYECQKTRYLCYLILVYIVQLLNLIFLWRWCVWITFMRFSIHFKYKLFRVSKIIYGKPNADFKWEENLKMLFNPFRKMCWYLLIRQGNGVYFPPGRVKSTLPTAASRSTICYLYLDTYLTSNRFEQPIRNEKIKYIITPVQCC